jgi:hypothetical protein
MTQILKFISASLRWSLLFSTTFLVVAGNSCTKDVSDGEPVIFKQSDLIVGAYNDVSLFVVRINTEVKKSASTFGLIETRSDYVLSNLVRDTLNFLSFRLLVVDTLGGKFQIIQNRIFQDLRPIKDTMFFQTVTVDKTVGYPYYTDISIININDGPLGSKVPFSGYYEGKYQILGVDTSTIDEQGLLNGVVAPDGKLSFVTASSRRFHFINGIFGLNDHFDGKLRSSDQANYATISADASGLTYDAESLIMLYSATLSENANKIFIKINLIKRR